MHFFRLKTSNVKNKMHRKNVEIATLNTAINKLLRMGKSTLLTFAFVVVISFFAFFGITVYVDKLNNSDWSVLIKIESSGCTIHMNSKHISQCPISLLRFHV